jgi:hypothetical protein
MVQPRLRLVNGMALNRAQCAPSSVTTAVVLAIVVFGAPKQAVSARVLHVPVLCVACFCVHSEI